MDLQKIIEEFDEQIKQIPDKERTLRHITVLLMEYTKLNDFQGEKRAENYFSIMDYSKIKGDERFDDMNQELMFQKYKEVKEEFTKYIIREYLSLIIKNPEKNMDLLMQEIVIEDSKNQEHIFYDSEYFDYYFNKSPRIIKMRTFFEAK